MTPDALRALTEGRDGHVIIESGPAGAIPRGKLHRDAHIIEGVTLITSRSSNGGKGGRRYSPQALHQIAEQGDNLPCFLNHTAPDKAFAARPVQDLVGRFVNVRHDPAAGKVTGDLHVAEHMVPLVFSLAERLGHQIGASLVSRGLVKMEGDTEVVDSIQALRSADLVSDPASTRGLFESLIEARHAATASESLTDVLDRVRGVTRVPAGTHQRLAEALTRPARSVPSSSSGEDLHSRLRKALVRP